MAGSLQAKRGELLQRYNSKATPTNYYKIPDTQNSIASQFPVQLGTYNAAEDQKWAMRAQLVGPGGAVDGVGEAHAPEEYFNYIQGKSEELTMNDFYNWLMSQADLSTPESAEYWFSKYKWMKELREDAAKKQHQLDWDLTEINLNGPQKEEDWLLLYMINQGLVQPPTQPTYKLYQDSVPTTNQYIAGLFSPMSEAKNFVPQPKGKVAWGDPLAAATGGPFPGFTNPALRAGGAEAFQLLRRGRTTTPSLI